MLKQGYVQVYTGTGKGKTTASLGLAVRAAGAGMKVLIIQFMKQRRCSEHAALERFSDLITVKQYGTGFVRGAKLSAAALKAAQRGLSEAREALAGAAYDLIILDEINVAAHCGLVSIDETLALIEARPASVELVLTGRYADKRIMAKADLVTEMREVKHYYKNGVASRKGIEC